MISDQDVDAITEVIKNFYPEVQGIYVFGSFGTEFERPDSDVDIALLLPHQISKKVGNLALSHCSNSLYDLLKRAADLVNIRLTNTVFQLQIIEHGRLVYIADQKEVDYFEMFTLSFYQKLQLERSAIIAQILETNQVLQI